MLSSYLGTLLLSSLGVSLDACPLSFLLFLFSLLSLPLPPVGTLLALLLGARTDATRGSWPYY